MKRYDSVWPWELQVDADSGKITFFNKTGRLSVRFPFEAVGVFECNVCKRKIDTSKSGPAIFGPFGKMCSSCACEFCRDYFKAEEKDIEEAVRPAHMLC